MLSRLLFLAAALGLQTAVSVLPVNAASFDCAKATTPFEKAICSDAELSKADERLARTYQTAIGGLSDAALSAMRADQRAWLDHARRACTTDVQPLTSGSYDERGVMCLQTLFSNRSDLLEQSRIIKGTRLYPMARYDALPDPNEADNPDSYYPVALHELAYVQIDDTSPEAEAFNALVRAEADAQAGFGADPDEDDMVDTSDTTNKIFFKEGAGTGRITLEASTYWYGHGAAHGNWAVTYLHYLNAEQRWLEASDLFAAKGWQKALLRLAADALRAEHGDNLYLDDDNDIAEVVTDPTRWDFSDPYGLIIQFQPYEVAPYVYGAPTARVAWDDLADYLSDGADAIRYGY